MHIVNLYNVTDGSNVEHNVTTQQLELLFEQCTNSTYVAGCSAVHIQLNDGTDAVLFAHSKHTVDVITDLVNSVAQATS